MYTDDLSELETQDKWIFDQGPTMPSKEHGTYPGDFPVQSGLTYVNTGKVTDLDFTGMAICSDLTTSRYSNVGSPLLGPEDQTWYVYASNHGRPSINKKIYWMNRDNVEISRTVVKTTIVASNALVSSFAYYGMWACELDAPIVSAVDKLKIYPIAISARDCIGYRLICPEQDRRISIRKLTSIHYNDSITFPPPQELAAHSNIDPLAPVEGGFKIGDLEGGDSGKPCFVLFGGELVCIIAGNVGATASPSIQFYADDLDIVTNADKGQILRRVDVPGKYINYFSKKNIKSTGKLARTS